jgi:hypothetical protein
MLLARSFRLCIRLVALTVLHIGIKDEKYQKYSKFYMNNVCVPTTCDIKFLIDLSYKNLYSVGVFKLAAIFINVGS